MLAAATKPAVRWGVGILSAPREPSTLSGCTAAAAAAGWHAPFIYCDTARSGCYRGWKTLAAAVLAINPTAHWLLLIEDDCILSEGLRAWLEFCPPDPDCWNSLYCASGLNLRANAGWREVQTPRQCWGSVAYLVTPQLLARFFTAPPYPTWRDGTDRAVGQWCRQNGVRYLVHSPSFAQHVGAVSSLDQPGGTVENRQYNNWVSQIVFGKSPGGIDAWGFLVADAASAVNIQIDEINAVRIAE